MATDPNVSDDLPILLFKSQKEWERWLAKNHTEQGGIWLRLAKKNSELTSVTYAEAVDAALCWGWIDGLVRKYDADSWIQKFTPRRKRSMWSKINREKVERLIAEGRMREPGLAEIERAKGDGRWDAAYDSAATAEPGPELQAALDASPTATRAFAALDRRNRYAIIIRVQTAVRPETRARRIEQYIGMLERGEKIHP